MRAYRSMSGRMSSPSLVALISSNLFTTAPCVIHDPSATVDDVTGAAPSPPHQFGGDGAADRHDVQC
jgi:hypothetical protein